MMTVITTQIPMATMKQALTASIGKEQEVLVEVDVLEDVDEVDVDVEVECLLHSRHGNLRCYHSHHCGDSYHGYCSCGCTTSRY